jgi:phosphonate transport system ATP-binding protein
LTHAIELEAVRVVAGGRVLLDVPSLVIDPGERVAVVGPNGAGKSTLLKLVGALLEARQGRVRVLGRSIGPGGREDADRPRPITRDDRRVLRRETGLLMQGLHLVPRLSARENVLVGALARLRGAQAVRSWWRRYPQALVAEADAALAVLGLADRADVRADRLSGGERQKVALARLQLQRPRLLLADEPTAALDPAATREVCLALRRVAGEPGRTLVTVVHDLELLPVLATRVIGLSGGRVRWDRPIAEASHARLRALYDRRSGDDADPASSDPSRGSGRPAADPPDPTPWTHRPQRGEDRMHVATTDARPPRPAARPATRTDRRPR